MARRLINFNPGPSTLPLPVLEQAQKELLDFKGTGMSILEHSHRGKDYEAVQREAKRLLDELMRLDDRYEILFMTGGATTQFALLPLNLIPAGGSADYVVTGTWGEKALAEAQVVGNARLAASSKDTQFTTLPDVGSLKVDSQAAYLHMTSNNTVAGTQFHAFPETGEVPLVADMSSDFLSRRLDFKRFGVIYAGAQKNLGAAGVTVVLLRKDLLERENTALPKIFRYQTYAKADSLQNTPPVFAIYMVWQVLKWIADRGGLKPTEERNNKKAAMLYETIDGLPDFYRCPVAPEVRSKMNVVFRLPTEELEQRFLTEAASHGMVGLKGHRSVGGIRASIYNAFEPSQLERLCEFMTTFASKRS